MSFIQEVIFDQVSPLDLNFFFVDSFSFALYKRMNKLQLARKLGSWKIFLYSSEVCSHANLPSLHKEIGDSLPFIHKEITPEQFSNWYVYHTSLYSEWEGAAMDCAYTYAPYAISGPQGKLTEAMIKNNLPLPIDIYVAKFVLPKPVVTHNMNQLLLIVEGFDTSRYNPVYYNDLEAIDFLKEHFQEHEMYPSDDEDDTVSGLGDTVSGLGDTETRTR